MKTILWERLDDPDTLVFMDKACSSSAGTALTIGGFDGPHLGHRLLLDAVLANAREHRHVPGIVTFIRSPGSTKRRESYPGDVSTLNLRLKRFEELGFAFALLIDFSADFSKMSGGVFFDILVKKVRMRYVAVGPDFRCGHRLDTGLAEISAIAHRDGFRFDSIQLVELDGLRISSSAVRKAIQSADFSLAERYLGHPFLLDFTALKWVVNGQVLEVDIHTITQTLPREGRYNVELVLANGTGETASMRIGAKSLALEPDTRNPLPPPDSILAARFRLS